MSYVKYSPLHSVLREFDKSSKYVIAESVEPVLAGIPPQQLHGGQYGDL